MEPVIVDQPILSWNDDIIKRFINNDHKYECFMNKSLKNDQLLEHYDKKKKSKLAQCSSKVETDSSVIAGSIYEQKCKHIQILHYIHFINISDKHDIHFTGNFCYQFTNDSLHMNNATSTSLIMLFCLIKGEKPDKAFKVIINKDKDVSDLKKVIKDEIPDDFAGIDAKNLTLWKVNVSANDKSKFERLETFIPYNSAVEEVLLGEKIENATEEVGKIFNYSLEKECIHIIIEPPAATEGTKVEEDVNFINKEDVSKGIANDRPTQNCEKQGFVTRYYSIPSQTSQTVKIDYSSNITSKKRYQKNEGNKKIAKRKIV